MWQRKLEFQTWYYISNLGKKQRLSKKISRCLQSLAPCHSFFGAAGNLFCPFSSDQIKVPPPSPEGDGLKIEKMFEKCLDRLEHLLYF